MQMLWEKKYIPHTLSKFFFFVFLMWCSSLKQIIRVNYTGNCKIVIHQVNKRMQWIPFSLILFKPTDRSYSLEPSLQAILTSTHIYVGQKYHFNYSKYSDTLTPYHTCPTSCKSLFHYLLMCLKYCWTSGKQAFCDVWTWSTQFPHVSVPILRVITVRKISNIFIWIS